MLSDLLTATFEQMNREWDSWEAVNKRFKRRCDVGMFISASDEIGSRTKRPGVL
jgi:hypothetical protein